MDPHNCCSATDDPTGAGHGLAGFGSGESVDDSDIELERIDRGNELPPAGIGGLAVCNTLPGRLEPHGDEPAGERTVKRRKILLACIGEEQWRIERLLGGVELNDSCSATSRACPRIAHGRIRKSAREFDAELEHGEWCFHLQGTSFSRLSLCVASRR